MLEKLFVIGIGGTGAKTMEAFVYLCAIGLGPKKADLFLIDIDTHNGNLTRTREIIEKYICIRKKLSDENKNDSHYFFTDIRLINSEPWSPLANKNLAKNTLGSFLDQYPPSPDRNYDLLRDVLFSKEELEVKLDTGCKAHPNIGSFLLATIFDDDGFVKALHETLVGEGDSGVFIFNSIFGGTGAAGGPVIIKGISDMFMPTKKEGDEKGLSRKPIGASVFMPYFTVPKSGETDELLRIKSETFALNAAAALPFYKDSVPADYIYILGDREGPTLKKYAAGSDEQCNDAHMLEFLGALYTTHFCKQNYDMSKPLQTNFRLIGLGNDSPDDLGIYFEDLPKLTFRNDSVLKKELINFQIFNIFYRHFYSQISVKQNIRSFVWLSGLIKDGFSLQDNVLNDMVIFLEGYSKWMQQMNTNVASLKIFNDLSRIDIMLDSQNVLEECVNIDNINKYLNVQKISKSGNAITDLFNLLHNGINKLIDKNKLLGGE